MEPINFSELKERINKWDIDAEEALLQKIEQFTKNYNEEFLAFSQNIKNFSNHLEEVEVDNYKAINQLKLMSREKFVENKLDDNEQSDITNSDVDDSEIKDETQRAKESLEISLNLLDEIRNKNKGEEIVDDIVSVADSKMMSYRMVKGMRLPYIIGSQDFNKDKAVGLDIPIEEEDDEEDKIVERPSFIPEFVPNPKVQKRWEKDQKKKNENLKQSKKPFEEEKIVFEPNDNNNQIEEPNTAIPPPPPPPPPPPEIPTIRVPPKPPKRPVQDNPVQIENKIENNPIQNIQPNNGQNNENRDFRAQLSQRMNKNQQNNKIEENIDINNIIQVDDNKNPLSNVKIYKNKLTKKSVNINMFVGNDGEDGDEDPDEDYTKFDFKGKKNNKKIIKQNENPENENPPENKNPENQNPENQNPENQNPENKIQEEENPQKLNPEIQIPPKETKVEIPKPIIIAEVKNSKLKQSKNKLMELFDDDDEDTGNIEDRTININNQVEKFTKIDNNDKKPENKKLNIIIQPKKDDKIKKEQNIFVNNNDEEEKKEEPKKIDIQKIDENDIKASKTMNFAQLKNKAKQFGMRMIGAPMTEKNNPKIENNNEDPKENKYENALEKQKVVKKDKKPKRGDAFGIGVKILTTISEEKNQEDNQENKKDEGEKKVEENKEEQNEERNILPIQPKPKNDLFNDDDDEKKMTTKKTTKIRKK